MTVAAIVLAPSRNSPAVRRRLRRLTACGVDVLILDDADHDPANAVAQLERGGIGPGLVLVVDAGSDSAASHEDRALRAGATEQELLELLDEQLARRRARRVPDTDDDPAWIVHVRATGPLHVRVAESVCTLAAGGFGTRGSVEESTTGSTPLVLADGVYQDAASGLLPGPTWTGLTIDPPPNADDRVLDLRTGVLARAERPCSDGSPIRTLRFASITRPGVVAMRVEGDACRLRAGTPLRPSGSGAVSQGRLAGLRWASAAARSGGGIAAVAGQRIGRDGAVRTVERVAAFVADPLRQPALAPAVRTARNAIASGFDTLLREQRTAWGDRWDSVGIDIVGDPTTELAVRYALFQLWSNVNRYGESAVGARGLSGAGYGGHVFWDADAFVLPAMVSIDPAAALAMLRYRLRRLPAALARATAEGRAGARFPWESAATGEDVTPRSGQLGGTIVPILTGTQEEHITADVAWAAVHYASWTGDATTHREIAPLLMETARYWASRSWTDGAGRAHLDGVIGPDEYHESVDDNAFTNVMARWNLRAGATAAERATPGAAGSADADITGWRSLADRLVDGYDPSTGRYEQFAGYFGLEPLLIVDVATPPLAADLLLGRDRIAHSQVIKQPDVLMLHHLVPGEVEAGSLAPNLDFYLPRTAHGSSLSPAASAALLARAGRADEALTMLGIALRLDLDDATGMTAGGLHLANLAGVWQAVLAGFGGVSVDRDAVHVEPHLPSAWSALHLRFRCLGRRLSLSITGDHVRLRTDGPIRVALPGLRVRRVEKEITT
jgi:trehalose/maltose hydrolase-like predicted phosphorylase